MLARAGRLAALAARGALPCCARRTALRALATRAPRDPYAVLGVSRTATLEEVKAAYRREALKWHPDRHPEAEREAASTKFRAISEAYQTLSDVSSRSRHDARASYEQAQRGEPSWGSDSARAGGSSAGGRAWSDAQQGRRPEGFSEAEAERLFRDVFGAASVAEMLRVAELLRRMQAQGGAARRGTGGASWEDVLGQTMRSAAAGARTEVESSIYIRPDGERVLRTVTTTIGRDGRVSQQVEERSIGRTTRGAARSGRAAQAEAAARDDAPDPPGILRQLLAPYIAAAGAFAAQAATRALISFVSAAVRAILRRLLGGR